MQNQDGFRTIRTGVGCLLGALAFTAMSSKLLAHFNLWQSKDTLIIVNIVSFSLFILLSIVWTIVGALAKVRFGLGKFLAVLWGSAACVTCIVSSNRAEIISLGISGLVILLAYLIAGVARANISKLEE